MWIISSHEVEQAKERLSGRRAEIEARYAAEKGALDAEFDAVETLERVAAEFAARNAREEPGAAGPAADAEQPADGDQGDGVPEVVDSASPDPPASASPGGEEAAGGFDIVKPGSRWRFARGARPTTGEESAGGTPPTGW